MTTIQLEFESHLRIAKQDSYMSVHLKVFSKVYTLYNVEIRMVIKYHHRRRLQGLGLTGCSDS